MKNQFYFLFITLFFVQFFGFSQENLEDEKSNIQTYTPSKLLNKGDWDFKIFNNLYTQTKKREAGITTTVARENYFTSTTEVYTGVSKSSRLNLGVIFNVKSNTFLGKNATSVFSFGNNNIDAKSGLSSIGLSMKIQPFKSISNFSVQSTFYFPVFKDEPGLYLDKRSYVFENRYFYDTTFGNGKYQFFAELDFIYHFGQKSKNANTLTENKKERFANNSLGVPVSVFVSYFPSDNFTVYVNAQHYELFNMGNDFTQNYTLLGFGGKYQLNSALNLEVSYANFVRGRDSGLGETFNIGLRYLLTK